MMHTCIYTFITFTALVLSNIIVPRRLILLHAVDCTRQCQSQVCEVASSWPCHSSLVHNQVVLDSSVSTYMVSSVPKSNLNHDTIHACESLLDIGRALKQENVQASRHLLHKRLQDQILSTLSRYSDSVYGIPVMQLQPDTVFLCFQ